MINQRLIRSNDEATVDTNKPSNYFNTVTYTGNGGTQRIGGYINRGAVFNGSTSYIDTGFSSFSTSFSFSFWMNESSLASGSMFGNWNATSANDIYIDTNSSGQLILGVDGISNQTFGTSGDISANTWHHIVMTFNNGAVGAYLDGASLGTSSTGNTSFSSGLNFVIGASSTRYNASHFSGVIDQFRIFNKALSSSEVTTLYGETHASTTKSTTDVFSDNSGVALYQLDGNANDTGTNNLTHYAVVNDAGGANMSCRLNSISSEFTYSAPSGFSDWGGAWDTSSEVNTGGGSFSYSESNKKIDESGGFYSAVRSENSYSSGKYYFEVEYLATDLVVGITREETLSQPFNDDSYKENAILRYTYSANLTHYSTINKSLGSTPSVNDVIGFAVDFDNEEVSIYVNNTLETTETFLPQYYNGTASNVTYQEATNFSPDLVWLKGRDTSGKWNVLYDSIRGATKMISSNEANAEQTYGSVTMDSNGFTLGSGFGDGNTNGENYVSWCFNAGTDAPVSNTDGSITSTVKANQDAGFSIVEWTTESTIGTVGHGLSTTPELIIFKRRDTSQDWYVETNAIDGSYDYLVLNSTAAKVDGSGAWSTRADSNTITSFTSTVNADYIAYCFHSVDGIQKVGSYTGTGAAGNIIETGFEPAFVMIKCSSAANGWIIWDNKRGGDKSLFPHSSIAEVSSTYDVDFTSNGFIIQSTNTPENASGQTYIYLAIAADPDTTTPTVENSFEVVTYTGNGGTQSIDTGFKPDLIWAKVTDASTSHVLFDSVRGRNSVIYSNLASQAVIPDGTTDLLSFDSNGFTVGPDAQANINTNGNEIVAYAWKAGDHDDNLPQINTEGTIDSVVSVNDAAGFSIVKWTGNDSAGATIGHGLSQTPELYIIKKTSASLDWQINLNSSVTGTEGYLNFNTNAMYTTFPNYYTSANNTVLSTNGTSTLERQYNNQSADYIAYCFTSITGYQKVGYFNQVSGTTTVSTGFEPRFLIIKRTDNTGNWIIFDSLRNDGDKALYANTSDDEEDTSGYTMAFNSDGFVLTVAAGSYDVDYIYLAIK